VAFVALGLWLSPALIGAADNVVLHHFLIALGFLFFLVAALYGAAALNVGGRERTWYMHRLPYLVLVTAKAHLLQRRESAPP
jgi:hypothetical protein